MMEASRTHRFFGTTHKKHRQTDSSFLRLGYHPHDDHHFHSHDDDHHFHDDDDDDDD